MKTERFLREKVFAKYSLPSISIHKFLTRGFSQPQIKNTCGKLISELCTDFFFLLLKQCRNVTAYTIFNILSNSSGLKSHGDVHELHTNTIPLYVRDLNIFGCWWERRIPKDPVTHCTLSMYALEPAPLPMSRGHCLQLYPVHVCTWTRPTPHEQGTLPSVRENGLENTPHSTCIPRGDP